MEDILKANGGVKRKFLREHRETILDCKAIFGEAFVKENFCVRDTTLQVLESGAPVNGKRPRRIDSLELKVNSALATTQKIDRLEAQIEMLRTQLQETQQKQRQLEELFQNFVSSTSNQVAKALSGKVAPLLERMFYSEAKLPKPSDPLAIDTLMVHTKAPAQKKRAPITC